MQSTLPRASEWVPHSSNQGDLHVVKIVASDPALHTSQELSVEQLLTVRSANGTEIAMDMISVMEPPEFPEEFTKQLDAATREHLKRWQLICRVSNDHSDAA